MKCFALVNSGLEDLTKREIKELVKTEVEVYPNVIEFAADNLLNLQSVRRLLISLGKTKDLNKFNFSKLPKLPDKFSFKVEVENVKGQDNRIEIAKKIAGKFFDSVEKENIKVEIELKKPELLLVIYFNGEEYFLGIDFNVGELNSRKYRVFAHQASFKGDLAYYFVRESGFKPGKKLLVGFCKDGAIAIEAALFSKERIFAFDESMRNLISARKNVKLAGVQENVEINKYSLDELDVKFAEGEFDNLIFHITTKDEIHLNEIYYQGNYILKRHGTLLLISRENWDLTISDKFILKDEQEIVRGESIIKLWLLEKK